MSTLNELEFLHRLTAKALFFDGVKMHIDEIVRLETLANSKFSKDQSTPNYKDELEVLIHYKPVLEKIIQANDIHFDLLQKQFAEMQSQKKSKSLKI